MSRLNYILIIVAVIATGARAQVGDDMPWSIVPESRSDESTGVQAPVMQIIAERSPLGLPGERPRLSMTMPLSNPSSSLGDDNDAGSAFSWSLKAWQMNTASLAHIQCSQGMVTMNSYLAQDCRFVDGPAPSDSVNLLQVSGDWMAAPGLQLGISAFRGDENPDLGDRPFAFDLYRDPLGRGTVDGGDGAVEGMDVNVSFGIQTERVGDFLVGLQLARYRQRMSLSDLAMTTEPLDARDDTFYSNSAQLLLGWRNGSFSGEVLGHHRELPLWLGPEQRAPGTLNSFDLEFSWHAQRNASLSIGVSNVMDAAPRADEPATEAAALEDPLESVYGRIPYVRYKHDL